MSSKQMQKNAMMLGDDDGSGGERWHLFRLHLSLAAEISLISQTPILNGLRSHLVSYF
jgi:hypothetical protein